MELEACLIAVALTMSLWLRPWRMLSRQALEKDGPSEPSPLVTPLLATLVVLPWLWALPWLHRMPIQLQLSGACLIGLALGWPLAVPLLVVVGTIACLISPMGWEQAVALTAWQGVVPATLALGLLLAVLTFTAVTLVIGQPFYDNLSERVDASESPDGTAPQSTLPFWRELWLSARDSVRILIRATVWGVLLFALGLLPFVGQTVIPVLGFFVTGFFLAEELTSIPLQRRGLDLRTRLTLLRSRRLLVWGYGTPLGLAFLVPFVAVFLMPGAVAGATLLARDLLGEESGPESGSTEPEPATQEQTTDR